MIGGGIIPGDHTFQTREGLQIKKIINEIYRNLNKYAKKQSAKEDFLSSSSLQFDPHKASSLIDKPSAPVMSNKDRVIPDYAELLERNEQLFTRPNDFIVGMKIK